VITVLPGRASEAPSRRPPPRRGFGVLVLAAAAATYLLIVVGGVVRVTGSGLGCGATGQDWPLCHGRLVPPADVATVIEFSHRSLATIASVLIVAVALVAVTRYRHMRRVVVPSTLVVVQLAVQILLGAATVEWKLPGGIVLVHLANALVLLAVLVWVATAVLTARNAEPSSPVAAAVRGGPASRTLARLGLIAAATTFVMVLSGGLVVANGAGYSCAGWPLCGGGLQFAGGQMAIVNLAHRGVIGVGTVVLVVVAVRALLALGTVPAVRATAVALAALLLSQFALGIVLVETHLPTLVRGLHEAFGSALWAAAVLLALLVQPQTLARLARRPSRDARSQPREPADALRPREALS